jgi:hypothetical protein
MIRTTGRVGEIRPKRSELSLRLTKGRLEKRKILAQSTRQACAARTSVQFAAPTSQTQQCFDACASPRNWRSCSHRRMVVLHRRAGIAEGQRWN